MVDRNTTFLTIQRTLDTLFVPHTQYIFLLQFLLKHFINMKLNVQNHEILA